jgi:hypothetical protein
VDKHLHVNYRDRDVLKGVVSTRILLNFFAGHRYR